MTDAQEIVNLGDLTDLDGLALSLDGVEPNILFGVSIVLFYEGGSGAERRVEANRVLRSYMEQFGERLDHYHPIGARRHRRIGKTDVMAYYDGRARTMPDSDTYGAGLYGYDEGKHDGRAPRYYVANIGRDRWQRYSSVEAYLPASLFARDGWDALVRLVLDWCTILAPAHGTAGLSYLPDPGRFTSHLSRLAFPGVVRYPGLDWPDVGRWRGEVRRTGVEAIRTINWLTVLNEGFIERIGGRDAMRASLGEDCPLHDWTGPTDSGTIIQAGPEPRIGDRNAGDIPEPYRKVARFTAPLRIEAFDPRFGLLNPPPPLDAAEESARWIKRFD